MKIGVFAYSGSNTKITTCGGAGRGEAFRPGGGGSW